MLFMKAVILAGGYGTRISEESAVRPKPMVGIGDKPILWHIMKIYSSHGINDFVICCGYKGFIIKEYFANYFATNNDVTFDLKFNNVEVHSQSAEPWRVTLIDTGLNTMTGGRIKRVRRIFRGRDLLRHLRRWGKQCGYHSQRGVSPAAGSGGNHDCGAATRTLWCLCAAGKGIQGEVLPRKAQGRRCLD